MLPALRGDEAAAIPLIQATLTAATAGGQGLTVGYATGSPRSSTTASPVTPKPCPRPDRPAKTSSGPCSSRCGRFPSSSRRRCAAGTPSSRRRPWRAWRSPPAGGTEFGLGIEARSRALLSDGATADRLYGEAIERLSRTHYRPDLGRAHLLYGEWLRRENRRTDARIQLRAAYDSLSAIGAEAFAERARRELQATGERVLKRSAEAATTLTAQEALIAQLARDGRTNPEIGAQLFLSTRTVQYHLRKVFTKLGITSRGQLRQVRPGH